LAPGDYTLMAQFNAQDFTPTTPTSYAAIVPADDFLRAGPFYFEPQRKIFRCGMAVTTFLGDYPSPYNIGNNGRVLAVKDIRNRTLAPIGVGSHWNTVTDIDNPAWRDSKMAQVYGIAADDEFYVYLTATRLYGPNAITPGSGLIFMINPFTGGVTELVTAINTPTVVGNTELENNNQGLGNISYNPGNEVLYVTNPEDATINVIAAKNNSSYATGEVIQSYAVTSFTPTNTSSERVWGIGFDESEGKVYFSSPQSTGSVDIIAADVDANGLIVGPETTLFPVAGVMNIADISFSFDSQRMLVGERNSDPHASHVYQYTKTGPATWGPAQEIYVGGAGSNINAAGGVDYAYTSFSGNAPPNDGCDTEITATGNALILTGSLRVYGFGIIPATGNAPGSFANLNSIFVDSDVETGNNEWDKWEQGDVEVFDCACAVDCSQLGLSVSATPEDTISVDNCCYRIDYLNTGPEDVYFLQFQALDGVEINHTGDPYVLAPGFMTSGYTPTSLKIRPVGGGIMPAMANGLISNFCPKNVLAFPQYVLVNYLDSSQVAICTDTLVFSCPVEETCLYIVSDTLECDSLGYKYTATVKNPSGADFPVGFIKLNVEPDIPGLTVLGGEGLILPDTLFQGDTTTIMWTLETSEDLFGDTLCFILSAHDGVEERLCCAEIDTCIAFPACDPCKYVDAMVKPLADDQVGNCCFELFVTDTFTYDPNLIQSIQVNILNPGVYYTGIDATQAQIDGWSISPPLVLPPMTNSVLWTHSSGITPNGVNYNLFDFCIEGTTSTDSVYIEVVWLDADSMGVCWDTLAIFCPECLNVINDTLTCQTTIGPAGGVTQDYVYTFEVFNYSPFAVNTIGIVENPSSNTNISPDVISIPTIPPFSPGGASVPISIIIDGSVGSDTTLCFDLVLRQVIADSIDILCCYATHCIYLPPCDSLPPFLCPNPELANQGPCPLAWDPVCGCDTLTYSNSCFASNAGVTYWTPGVCDTAVMNPDPRVVLSGSLGASGEVLLDWMLNDDPSQYSHFVLRNWPAGGGAPVTLAVLPALAGQQQYNFVDLNAGSGIQEYDVLAVDLDGHPVYSNVVQVLLMNGLQQRAMVYTYPVPATNYLNVTSNLQGDAVLELISTDGRTLLQRRETFQGLPVPVDVSGIGSGVYMVRLSFRSGDIGQQRIVKME
ncbi:MAG: T9SS type A sorting domain-containing protein, partial [Phaeodactylibacter sp.]|nr:T9SS type A sorting domain-containing protein [Phaeodactylibacter sp.]